jgi:hypothetical protein
MSTFPRASTFRFGTAAQTMDSYLKTPGRSAITSGLV